MGIDVSQVDSLADDLFAAPPRVTGAASLVVGETATMLQADAQRFAPVLTGALRESITADSHGLTAEVSADSDYAAYVEYGTSDTAPQPFMRPAADLAEPRLAEGLAVAGSRIL